MDYLSLHIQSLALIPKTSKWTKTQLNRSVLRKELKKWWNADIFLELKRIIEFYYPRLESKGVEENRKGVNFLDKFTVVSTDSAEGYVAQGGFQHIDKIVAVKFSKYATNIEHLFTIHEYVIGEFLNVFRKTIPNFVFTYGTTRCQLPRRVIKGDFIPICRKGNGSNIQHLFLEYVDGVPLANIANILSINELGKIMLCIFCALASVTNYKFCHYDLHGKNIMIRKEPKLVSIKYIIDGKQIIVNTRYIPVILDFGYSYLKINEFELYSLSPKNYLIPTNPPRNVFHEYHPYIDWHKLFVYTLITTQNYTMEHHDFFVGWFQTIRNKMSRKDIIRIENLTSLVETESKGMFHRSNRICYTYDDYYQSAIKSYSYPLEIEKTEIKYTDFLEYLIPKFSGNSNGGNDFDTTVSNIYNVEGLCNGETDFNVDINGVKRGVLDCFKKENGVVIIPKGTTLYRKRGGYTPYFNDSDNDSGDSIVLKDDIFIGNDLDKCDGSFISNDLISIGLEIFSPYHPHHFIVKHLKPLYHVLLAVSEFKNVKSNVFVYRPKKDIQPYDIPFQYSDEIDFRQAVFERGISPGFLELIWFLTKSNDVNDVYSDLAPVGMNQAILYSCILVLNYSATTDKEYFAEEKYWEMIERLGGFP